MKLITCILVCFIYHFLMKLRNMSIDFPKIKLIQTSAVKNDPSRVWQKEYGICGSRQELSNEYVDAKIGVDIAENEPSKISSFTPNWGSNFHTVIRHIVLNN